MRSRQLSSSLASPPRVLLAGGRVRRSRRNSPARSVSAARAKCGRAGSRDRHARRRIAQAEAGRRARRSRQDGRRRAEADARAEDRSEAGARNAHQRAAGIQLGQPQANERNLIGYYVSRQVEVDLRDLEKLGQLLERATDLGVNQVGDPRLDSSKRQELEREALAKAVVDARLNAEVIAKAAGAKLGTARTISANSEFTPPPMPMVRAMAMEAEAAGARAVSERRDDFQRDGASSVRSDRRSERCHEHASNRTRRRCSQPCGSRACAAHAIEAPKPQPAPEQPPEAAAAASRQSRRRTSARSTRRCSASPPIASMRGLKIPAEVIAELGARQRRRGGCHAQQPRGRGQQRGEHRARARSALVQLRHVSSAPAIRKCRSRSWLKGQPEQRAARVAGVMYAEVDYMQRARAGCSKARFDYTGIEARLRAAADAGDPASATELAQFLRDPAKREAMLQSAVEQELPARDLQSRHQPADRRAARRRRPRTSVRSASCSRSRAARSRGRSWTSRIAWRSAATAIRPMR